MQCSKQGNRLRRLFNAGIICLLAGCGKVGDPLPPFIRVPAAVKDLAATQSGYNIVLTWTNPPRNIDGSAATNLAHVQIRNNEKQIAAVNVTAAGQPQAYAIPVDRSDSAERRFTLLIDTVQGKLSDISNAVTIRPVEVPGSISGLRGAADQRRIILTWDKPREHPELADGYIVTRSDTPAESETVPDLKYEDTRYEPGKAVTYQVTAVRRVSGNAIAGIGPEEVRVVAEDKTPPQVPTGLDIVRSDTGAYLTWNANAETDLAGYRVFRSDRPDGDFMPAGDRLTATNGFIDTAYRPGLYYAVSAIDEFGNESAMSAPFRSP